jgi:hypothetical protein
VKFVPQLRCEGTTRRAITLAQGRSRKSVSVFDAAGNAGIGGKALADRSEVEVCALLFPGRGEHESVFAQPDW